MGHPKLSKHRLLKNAGRTAVLYRQIRQVRLTTDKIAERAIGKTENRIGLAEIARCGQGAIPDQELGQRALHADIAWSDVHKTRVLWQVKVVACFAAMTGIASIQREFMPGLRIDDSRSIPNSTIGDREIECRSRQKRL